MNQTKLSDNKKNYRKLAIFIDNIISNTIMFESYKNIELNYVCMIRSVRGNLTIVVENIVKTVQENEVIFASKGKVIQLFGQSEGEVVCEIITIGGSGASVMLDYLGFEELETYPIASNLLVSIYEKMKNCLASGENFRAVIELQNLLITIKDTMKTDYASSNMERIYHYIMNNYTQQIELSDLAADYGTSISYFSREFKRRYHVTPMNLVNQLRMDKARTLLESTKLKISDVAANCGYDKTEYFCYVFKKTEGCTPSQYRKNRNNITFPLL